MWRTIKVFLPIVLLAGATHGQSLGEVARRNRDKKEKNGPAAKKIITTDDLSSDAPPDPLKPEPSKPEPYKKMGYSGYTPEFWKRVIEGQKKWLVFLEAEKDKLNAAGQVKLDPKDIARDPKIRKQWEEQGIQEQFASQIPEQKKKLEELQQEARKAGMPPEVYDPQ